jgi:hypothetical protein
LGCALFQSTRLFVIPKPFLIPHAGYIMKVKTIAALSLVLNLLLAVGLFLSLHKQRSTSAFDSGAGSSTNAAVKPAFKPMPSEAAAGAPSSVNTNRAEKSFDWRMVESEDYKKYIANLRAIGCPENTIRDIIIADVNSLFESRKKALRANTKKFEFWKAGNMFAAVMDEDKIKQSQEMAQEKRTLLKDLLGVAPDEKPDLLSGMNPFESMLDFLPAEKQTGVMEVLQKYQAKIMKSFSGGAPDADDLKKVQLIQKDMEKELGTIMTPDELQDYQLRMSQTSMMMRMTLSSFDPNQKEFVDIFNLKKPFDDEFGAYGMTGTTPEEQKKRNASETELSSKIKEILGDDRYKDYERSQDFVYQGLYKLAEKNGLDKSAAISAYEMKKAAEDQAGKVRGDPSLTPAQRTAALESIRTETDTSLKQVLGGNAWQSYQSQPGAYWLNNISPAKTTASK